MTGKPVKFVLVIFSFLLFFQLNAQERLKRDVLAAVKIDDKWGYINTDGKVVIEPEFIDARGFSETLAAVKQQDNWGYIDRNGNWVLSPALQVANNFNNNRAYIVFVDKRDSFPLYAYINKNGLYAFEIHPIEKIGSYHDGMLRMMGTSDWGELCYGFKDTTGNWAIKPKYKDAADFSEGVAGVFIAGKWGFIDRTDSFVAPSVYDEIFNYNDGVAWARAGKRNFIIDKTGKVLLSTDKQLDYMAQDGLVGFKENGKYGFMNLDGKVVVKPVYEDMTFNKFSEGLAIVKKNVEGKMLYGYIDKSGNEVIPAQFEFALPFSQGFAAVMQAGKYGFIDKKGKWLTQPMYQAVTSFLPTY